MASKFKNKLPWGFVSLANEYAREFRQELDIKKHEPLNPWTLAKHLLIPVVELSYFKTVIPNEVDFFHSVDPSCFSALTVFDGSKRMIVNNDIHSIYRQAADISHELGHAILDHRPTNTFDKFGCRNFNQDDEAQANYLGPALLISEEAALHVCSTEMDMEKAMNYYGVSKQLLQMRINNTGAVNRINRGKFKSKFRG